jgi:hypothetical protein
MAINSIRLSPGNKPENFSKRREQCGAIGQSRNSGPREGRPDTDLAGKDEKARPKRPLALSGLEAPLRLVDDVDAALAPHEAIVAVAAAQGFQ